ncbi:MAG: R3H domain-containing nucleic acid-binding protein [Candidatus Moraniibacteriota bacterium]
MEKEQIESQIGSIVTELIEKMGFSVVVEIKSVTEKEGVLVVCDIKTQESNFLIGQYGMNLQSLQHIARVMVRKKIEEPVNFVLDVNSYRKEKNESIVRLALNLAEEACAKKETIVMRPMSAYERRVVHVELSKNDKIKTESVGDGEDRRIAITPIELA